MTHLRYQLDDITMNRTEQNSIIIQDMYIVYGHNERLYTYNKQELHSEQTQGKKKEIREKKENIVEKNAQ